MKTLIVYASKYGCTADCADYLKAKLPGEVALIDINKANDPIELEAFDTIIIGGSVYIGKVSKKLRAFCESNLDALCQKNVGIFLCCALAGQVDEVLAANFPAALLKHAKTIKTFGSKARLEKMSLPDKMIVKAVTKGDFSNFKVSEESMEAFVKEIS